MEDEMIDKKISSAIDIAVSLIRTAKFIGIDDDGQKALESFVDSLDDSEREELEEKESVDRLKTLSSFFERTIHESSFVCFEVQVESLYGESIDVSRISVLGPARSIKILSGKEVVSDSFLQKEQKVLNIIAEIDHDCVNLVESNTHRLSSVIMDFEICSPFKTKILNKKYI